MKISVVIPVYNVERYLGRCLDSVLAAIVRLATLGQEFDAEVICVNDGSTDGSADILSRYANRVKIIEKENGGQGSARNSGLAVATGDYVMFVDSDDWIPEWAIVRFAEVAKESGASLVVSTSFSKDVQPVRPSSAARWAMRPTAWIAGQKVQYCVWNKLYRAELFRRRHFPATVFEDFPVITDIFCEVREFAVVDEPLYVYCTNVNTTVRSAFTERKMRDSMTVVRLVLETARGQTDPRMACFALRQAADGHSSTVGQVYKAHDPALTAKFLAAHDELVLQYPELERGLRMKAKFRLWRLRRSGVSRHVVSPFLKIAIDPDELAETIARTAGLRYRLTALNVKCTCPVFRGEADGLPPVCVKLDYEDEWRRTASLLRAFRGSPLFSKMPYDGKIDYHGRAVSVFDWREAKVVRPENMTERQAESFREGCLEIARAFGAIRDDASVCVPTIVPEELYETVSDYAQQHPLVGRFLRNLLMVPAEQRTYGNRVLPVAHGDFHSRNFRFEGERLSHVFDFGLVRHDLACTDMANAFLERYSCLNLPSKARHRLDKVTSRVLSRTPWPREELVIACNIVRLQFAARRIRKHPNSAWVAFDVWRRDRKIREFLRCVPQK